MGSLRWNKWNSLRDRFIVGARQDDGLFAKTIITGGLTQIGGDVAHNHGGVTGPPSGSALYWPNDSSVATANHTHSVSDDEHIPPYYALAFIMKL